MSALAANRKTAERALTKRQAEEDDGAFVPQKTIRFDEWADRWLAGLERKPNTVDGYSTTTRYAKQAFGDVLVRRLTVEHVKTFLRVCSEARRGANGKLAMSDSTRAKHLRVLGICLESAIRAGYAGRNPVRDVPNGERPRKRRQEAAYFTNDELPVLFEQFRECGDTYRVLFELALKTGMRQGELAGRSPGPTSISSTP